MTFIDNQFTQCGAMNLTLVAFYGSKPATLGALIDRIQQRLVVRLGGTYVPFESRQVHATLVGLEGWRVPDGCCNANFWSFRNERRLMDFPRLMKLLDDCDDLLPFTVRIGGFAASAKYAFTSRGQHPYTCSIVITGGSVAIMGWPVEGNTFTSALGRLRRELESANVLHKYHVSESDFDNDLFLVLGRFDSAIVERRVIEDVQSELRTFLAAVDPVRVALRRDGLAVVAYADPSLPVPGSRVFSIAEAASRFSDILPLYAEGEPSA